MFQEFTWPLREGWMVGSKTGFKCVVVRNGNNLAKEVAVKRARSGQNQIVR